MSGISLTGPAGANGLVRSYQVIIPSQAYEAPDDTIGLYAKAAGNVTFTTVDYPNVDLTFPMVAGQTLDAEVKNVSAFSGGANNLYAAIR